MPRDSWASGISRLPPLRSAGRNVTANELGRLRQLVAEEAADMTALVGPEGAFSYASPSTPRVVGWLPDDLVGRMHLSFVHPDDQAQVAADVMSARSGRQTTTTLRFHCADGGYRWLETKYRAGGGDPSHVVASLRDIAERERVELALRQQLSLDPLTGVGNRSLFSDRLQHALVRLTRQPGRLAVLMLDVDRFKVVNDALGHAAGDQVLVQLAARLLRHLRPGDTLARLGGDEFAILAEDLSSAHDALQLAERITREGQTPLTVGTEEVLCTLSVGVAVTDQPGHAPEDLLQQADMALYRAKDRGRDRAEVFDEDLRSRAVSRLATERMLRRALSENRLCVEYQPIVRLPGHDVVGAEALVRIHDGPSGALLQPSEFLVVAEETGLLKEMDEWVMDRAVDEVAAWAGLPGTPFRWITLNVTARQLAGGRLLDRVLRGVQGSSISPGNLRLEVTEQVLMSATHSAISTLQSVREAGVQVGLDDFGTGHSSLSYLRSIPIDYVTIDKSFIARVDQDATDRTIVLCIIDLCHAIGLSVIAEGVENQAQADLLEQGGCDFAQGFLYGASMSPAELTARLSDAG